MTRTRTLQLVLLSGAFALTAAPAAADPIRTVISGTVASTSGTAASVTLSGADFAVTGHFFEGTATDMICQPCEAGDNINIVTRWGPGNLSASNLSVTVGQQTFTNPFLTGLLAMGGESTIAPANAGSLLVVKTPAHVSGDLLGWADPQRSVPLFGLQFGGSGMVTLELAHVGNLYFGRSVVYTFGEQPAATPEPGSALLLLTGLGGAAAMGRRRRPLSATSPPAA